MVLQHKFPFVEPNSGDIGHKQINGVVEQGTTVAVMIMRDVPTVLLKHLKSQGNLIFVKAKTITHSNTGWNNQSNKIESNQRRQQNKSKHI